MLRRLDDWVAPGTTLVAFNAGLHDLRRSGRDGRHRVGIDRYETNLVHIVRELRERGVTAVFVTTTRVDDDRHAASGKPERLAADVERYNEAARRVMEELGVPVVDLFPVVGPALIAGDGVHLAGDGYAAAADAVAAGIAALL